MGGWGWAGSVAIRLSHSLISIPLCAMLCRLRAASESKGGRYLCRTPERETHPTEAAALLIIQGQPANRAVYMQPLVPSSLVFSSSFFEDAHTCLPPQTLSPTRLCKAPDFRPAAEADSVSRLVSEYTILQPLCMWLRGVTWQQRSRGSLGRGRDTTQRLRFILFHGGREWCTLPSTLRQVWFPRHSALHVSLDTVAAEFDQPSRNHIREGGRKYI